MADKSTGEIGAQFINRFHGTLASSALVDLATVTLPSSERNKLNPEARTFKIIEMFEKAEELAFEKDITGDERKARGERLGQIVNAFIDESIIKKEDVPDSYFQNQIRILEERGHGRPEISEAVRQQEIERIQNEQRASLRNWTDYLLSNDARSAYPTWFRFYVLKNISNLKSVDKQKATYPKRDKNYVGVFPELNREVLSNLYKYVKEAAEIQFDEKAVVGLRKEEVEGKRKALSDKKKLLDIFGQLAYQGKFGQLYYNLGDRQREQQLVALKERGMSGTEGEWKTFAQCSGTDELVKSLEGKGTGWCIAGKETASNYLEQGDMHIYFTKDSDGSYTLPRVAIRMEGGSVAEVRGVEKGQNLEPDFVEIAKEKYSSLPGGERYDKKVNDMRRLTEIEDKTSKNMNLTKDEVSFLYEVDNVIDGFGYFPDPRIESIKSKRNIKNDALIYFECTPDEVADVATYINRNTKLFTGKLEKEVISKLRSSGIKKVYTSFPKGYIQMGRTVIGGIQREDLLSNLRKNNTFVSSDALYMINSLDLSAQTQAAADIEYISLSVKDLGFVNNATISEVFESASKIGLSLMPVDAGMYLVQDRSLDGMSMFVAMERIDRNDIGLKSIFQIAKKGSSTVLDAKSRVGYNKCELKDRFIFRVE